MINKIGFQYNCKNNISFGLNATNRNAIYQMHTNPQDRLSAIQSFDMTDPDISPCFDEFSVVIAKNPTRSNEMIAILDKLDAYKKNDIRFRECLSGFVDYWSNFFLSTRTKAAELMDSIGIYHPPTGYLSRTATNPFFSTTALKNIERADRYICLHVEKGVCPDKEFLKELHRIHSQNIPIRAQDGILYNEEYCGVIRNSAEDKLMLYEGKGALPEERLDKFMAWLDRNYSKDDAFELASQSYKKLLGICPFYDANGRTIRSFIDALLLSRGYRFKQYPANYAEVINMPTKTLRGLFEENCEEVPEGCLSLNTKIKFPKS